MYQKALTFTNVREVKILEYTYLKLDANYQKQRDRTLNGVKGGKMTNQEYFWREDETLERIVNRSSAVV